jgi:hypothetical protein
MILEIELRSILFSLINLEMFLQLDWSPLVVNSIDLTWFGKAHTWQYKVLQLTVHVRAKAKPWGWRNCPYSSETGLWRGTDLGKGTKKCLQHWKSPKAQWPPSFLKQKKSGPTKNLSRAGRPAKLSNRGRRALVREVNKMVTDRAPEFLCGDGIPSRKTTISAALHFMVEWPDGSHSSVKGTSQPTWSLPKGT